MKRVLSLFLLLATTSNSQAATAHSAIFADGTREGECKPMALISAEMEDAAEDATENPIQMDPRFTHLYNKLYVPFKVMLSTAGKDLQRFRHRDYKGYSAYADLVNYAYNRTDGKVVCDVAMKTIYDYIHYGTPSYSELAREKRILHARAMIKKAQEEYMHPDIYAGLCAIKREAKDAHMTFVEAVFNAFEECIIKALTTHQKDLCKAGVFADEELVFEVFSVFEELLLYAAASASAIAHTAPTDSEQGEAMLIISRQTAQLTHRLAQSLHMASGESTIPLAIEDTPCKGSHDSLSSQGSSDTDSGIFVAGSPRSSTSMSSLEASPDSSPKPSKIRLSIPFKVAQAKKVSWLDLYEAPKHWTDEVQFDVPDLDINVWELMQGVPGVRRASKAILTVLSIPNKIEETLSGALEELRIANEILAGSGLIDTRHDGGCPCCCDWQDLFEDDTTRQTDRK